MKKIIKKVIRVIISNDLIYNLFDKLLTYGWMIKFQRQLLDRKKFEIKQNSLLKQLFTEPRDNIKAKNYSFTELESLDLLTKYRIFEEGRRYVDEWLIISPN